MDGQRTEQLCLARSQDNTTGEGGELGERQRYGCTGRYVGRHTSLTAAIEPYGDDAIVVTLSSLTRHIVGSLHTSPAPFPLADSLRLSVGSRDCFYDYLHTVVYSKERLRDEDLNDRDVTARMSGLAGVGTGWAVDSWAVE